jgi:hypothetical protein
MLTDEMSAIRIKEFEDWMAFKNSPYPELNKPFLL